jgi:hypothetical protein
MEELSPKERAVSMVIIGVTAKFSGVVAAGMSNAFVVRCGLGG